MKYNLKLALLSLVIMFCQSSSAVQIVRVQLDYDNKTELIDLELFDDQVGPTVANFLSYVNSGRYDGTFFYRALPDFVIQTGGFAFRPDDPLVNGLRPLDEPGTGLELVPEDSTIVINDPVIPNLRGTLGLAKLPSSPDSGSNEWFINLADNTGNLGVQNGGFTVFGSVIDNGMIIADEISLFPIQEFAQNALGSSFASLPVVNYDFVTFPVILQANLIMLTSFTIIDRPIIRTTPSLLDLELDNATDGLGKTLIVTIENTGTEILNIGTITDLVAPYNIANDNCSSTSLDPISITPSSNCTIDVVFSAASIGTFDSSVTIPYTSAFDAEAFTVTSDVTGEGVPATPVLDTSINDFIFIDTIINATVETTITVRNRGDGVLTINSIGLSGTDSNQFTIDSAGCIGGTALTINQTCDLLVTFAPTTNGLKNASLDIDTNASIANIALSGLGTKPVIDPPIINTILASLNETESEFVSITNIGTGILEISSLIITGTGADAFSQVNNCPNINNSGAPDSLLGAGGTCLLAITYAPTDGSNKSATIVIESNDPDSPTVNVDISGIISDPFIFTVSSFDLGTTEIGAAPSVKELIVTNTGSAALLISGVSGLLGTEFSQTNDCDTQVDSNNTCSIFVSYTPTTLGAVTTPLTLTSNDPANPTVDIDITGFGINTPITDPFISAVDSVDFGTGEIGSAPPPTIDIIIINRGMAPLIISDISSLSTADFSQTNNCDGIGVQLLLDESCTITVTYTAVTFGDITETLTITSNDPDNIFHDIEITGSGVDNVIEDPSISTESTFNVGTAQINGLPAQKIIVVTNNGLAPLIISEVSGLTSDGFSQVNGCEGANIEVATNASCGILVTYLASTGGAASDTVTILSNDPLNPVINITINAFGDNDIDGILSAIELAAPNSGDNNNDGVSDDVQNNVASLLALNSQYITFVSDASIPLGSATFLEDVAQVDTTPAAAPDSASFSYGLFSYAIRLPSGDGSNLAILLPKNENPNAFYIYGPTADDTTDHWYNFSYDETTGTGAQFFGEVSFLAPSGGSTLKKNLVILSYKDGLRGDDDLLANGAIINKTSGLSLSKSSSKSSSGALLYLPVYILLIIRLFRTVKFNNKQLHSNI